MDPKQEKALRKALKTLTYLAENSPDDTVRLAAARTIIDYTQGR